MSCICFSVSVYRGEMCTGLGSSTLDWSMLIILLRGPMLLTRQALFPGTSCYCIVIKRVHFQVCICHSTFILALSMRYNPERLSVFTTTLLSLVYVAESSHIWEACQNLQLELKKWQFEPSFPAFGWISYRSRVWSNLSLEVMFNQEEWQKESASVASEIINHYAGVSAISVLQFSADSFL